MKVKKKVAAMLMSAVIGGLSCMSVCAEGEHPLEHVESGEKTDFRSGDCIHCSDCVGCKDDILYRYTWSMYYCEICDKYILHDDLVEIGRNCACSNSACCN